MCCGLVCLRATWPHLYSGLCADQLVGQGLVLRLKLRLRFRPFSGFSVGVRVVKSPCVGTVSPGKYTLESDCIGRLWFHVSG